MDVASSSLKWFIPFCGGIVVAKLLFPNASFSAIFIESTILLSLLVFVYSAHLHQRNTSIFVSLTALLFLLGFELFQLNQAYNNAQHYRKKEAYYFEGQIVEINKKENSAYMRLLVQLNKAVSENGSTHCMGKALVYIDSTGLAPIFFGEHIAIKNAFEPIKNKGNPGEFDASNYWSNLGIYDVAFLSSNDLVALPNQFEKPTLFQKIQSYFSIELSKYLQGNDLAVAKALLLGEKSDISADLMNAFSGTGAMHLLSVSGLHIGIFVWILQFVLQMIYPSINQRIEIVLLLAILWIYTGITGFSPSVNRAAIMFSFFLLARLLGRKYNSIHILFLSAFFMLVYNPNYLFDIGFQLSYSAILGIFLFYPSIFNKLTLKRKWVKKIWETTALGIAAQLLTLPFTLYYFHQFPNYFLLTNIVLMVLSGVIMSFGVAFLFFTSLPVVAFCVAKCLYYSIHGLIVFIEYIYKLPYAVSYAIPFELTDIAFIFLFIAAYLLFRKQIIKIRFTLVFLIVICSYISVKNYAYLKQNYFSTQIWVLNHSSPLFFVKKNGQGLLILVSNDNEKSQKLAFIKRGLVSRFGRKIKIITLKKQEKFSSQTLQLVIEPKKGGLLLKGCVSAFYLTGNEVTDEEIRRKEFILGTWSPYFLGNEITAQRNKLFLTTYALKEQGAIQLATNEKIQ
jgi:competence protein ComEC